MSVPADVGKVLIGLIPSLVEVIAEALRAKDPKRALRVAAAAMAAERAAHAGADALIRRRRKGG